MSEIENPPAFPTHPGIEHQLQEGMSLRDYIAGCALSGLAASAEGTPRVEMYALGAYAIADAMLAARKAPRS